jgi:SAM-dependent methyltransferase
MSLTDGVQTFVRSSDLMDPTLKSYFQNYDELAETDLKQAIVDEVFVKNLAQNLVDSAGEVSGNAVCDLGSGKGYAARMLASKGAKVTAVDISVAYLKTLAQEQNLRPVLANAENLPFRDHFDLLVSTDVMEHVLNLGSFLFCVNRALKMGGRFLVRVPYREDLLTYSPHLGCPYRFVHLRTFNRGSLKDCLVQSGFKVRKIWLDGFFWGKPKAVWFSKPKLGSFYSSVQRRATALGWSDANVTRLNPTVLSVFMQPSMIVADVEKILDLEATRS